MCRGLTLIHPAPRRPAAYGAVSDFTTTPSCPWATAPEKKDAASSGEAVTTWGMSADGGTTRSSAERREAYGWSSRSAPSTCSASNQNALSGTESAAAAADGTGTSRAARAAVSWNARGRPSARSAISSPSSTASRTGSADRALTISGSRDVMSSSVRVKS